MLSTNTLMKRELFKVVVKKRKLHFLHINLFPRTKGSGVRSGYPPGVSRFS